MISREELRRLAEFECRLPNELAVTFYFQPGTPKDKSHREEAIEAKELVRKTLQELEVNGRSREVLSDLQQILRLAEGLHGNQARAKVVFACSGRKLWSEFDVPAPAAETGLFVNRRFHLKPLAPLFSEYPHLWVAVVDRHSARFVDIYLDQVNAQSSIENSISRSSGSLTKKSLFGKAALITPTEPLRICPLGVSFALSVTICVPTGRFFVSICTSVIQISPKRNRNRQFFAFVSFR